MDSLRAARQRSEIKAGLLEAIGLKELARAGWDRVGVTDPESVAAHSWGVAWLVLALCPEGVDRGRALAMAVLHDLPEVRIGDLTPHDDVPATTKRAAEHDALRTLVAALPRADELLELWREYEHGSSPEGRFVKACDRLDMALQAERYREAQGVETGEFVESALASLQEPELRTLIR